MSTIYIKDIDQHTLLGLYSIDKNLRIEDACPSAICKELQNKSMTRQQETAAVYMLLREMIGLQDFVIEHESSGKPFISICGKPTNYKIGISHTKGYVSVIVSTTQKVSVDIEYQSDRVQRIASRFLREDEMEDINKSTPSSTLLLLYWCAKETIYKLYSDASLTFQRMKASNIGTLRNEGEFACKNLINDATVRINYILDNHLVLTYCKKE